MLSKVKLLLLIVALLATSLIAGCDNVQLPPANPGTPEKQQGASGTAPADTMRIVVYHATKDATYLVPEVHSVPKTDTPAHAAIELLLAEPKTKDLVKALPDGTKLRNLSIKNHIAYADFNDKLVKNNPGGSAAEMLIVAAIVNTLTEFPEVQKVQIQVEGKKVETLSGHLDISEPLSRSEQIIKKTL
jgi:spore germination protein GerM